MGTPRQPDSETRERLLGVSVDLNSDDVMLDGQRFTKNAIVPFAAVHLGYRFR